MMDYEMFRDVVAEKFLSHMPAEYRGMAAAVTVEKVSRRLDGISLRRTDGGNAAFPVIYINDMYADYMRTGNLQSAMEKAAASMDAAARRSEDLLPLGIRSEESKIIFRLVNTLQNEEMLKNMPHREFNDLSIVYRLAVRVDERGTK